MGCIQQKSYPLASKMPSLCSKPEIIFILGGPCSGKRTQIERLIKDYGFLHISMKELLQQNLKRVQNTLNVIGNIPQENLLTISELCLKLIQQEFISNKYAGRYLIEGFPATLDDLDLWNKSAAKDCDVHFAINLDCSIRVMEERLMNILKDHKNPFEVAEAPQRLIQTFFKDTMPVIKALDATKKLHTVYGNLQPDLVYSEIVKWVDDVGIKKFTPPIVIFMMGGPGSGKGSVCQRISRDYHYTYISTGDQLREEYKSYGPMNQRIQECMSQGRLVPSEMLLPLIRREFVKQQMQGQYVIECFPRNQENYDHWAQVMAPYADVRLLLSLECSADVLKERVVARNAINNREQDSAVVVGKKINAFQLGSTTIIKEFKHQNKLAQIPSQDLFDATYSQVKKQLKGFKLNTRPDGSQAAKLKYVIFIQGGPGCGKTTQSIQICKEFGFEYISVEELTKGYTYKSVDEVTKFKGVSVGGRTCSTDHARQGNNSLSSQLLVRLIERRMHESLNRKFLLEGFPRKQEDIDSWQRDIISVKFKYLLTFVCDQVTMTQRLIQRGQDHNDEPDAIKRRMDTYLQEIKPSLQIFETDDRAIIINGDQEVGEVFLQINSAFQQRKLTR